MPGRQLPVKSPSPTGLSTGKGPSERQGTGRGRRRGDVGRGEGLRGPGRWRVGTGGVGSPGNVSFNPLTPTAGGVSHHPHFTEEETEAGSGRHLPKRQSPGPDPDFGIPKRTAFPAQGQHRTGDPRPETVRKRSPTDLGEADRARAGLLSERLLRRPSAEPQPLHARGLAAEGGTHEQDLAS